MIVSPIYIHFPRLLNLGNVTIFASIGYRIGSQEMRIQGFGTEGL